MKTKSFYIAKKYLAASINLYGMKVPHDLNINTPEKNFLGLT